MNRIIGIIVFLLIVAILIKFIWKLAIVIFIVGLAYYIYKFVTDKNKPEY